MNIFLWCALRNTAWSVTITQLQLLSLQGQYCFIYTAIHFPFSALFWNKSQTLYFALKISVCISKRELFVLTVTPNTWFLTYSNIQLFIVFCFLNRFYLNPDISKIYILWLIEISIRSLLIFRFFPSIFSPLFYLLKKLSCLTYRARVGKVFLKGLGRKCISHCRPCGLSHCSTLPL